MILAVILLIAVFVATRFLMMRSKASSLTANVVGGVVVFAFIVGSLARPFGFPNQDVPVATTAEETQTPPPTPEATFPGPRLVSSGCKVGNLKMKKALDGWVDAFVDTKGNAIADGAEISRSATYTAIGWAVDTSGTQPAEAVCLTVDGKILPAAHSLYGLLRTDVAGSFQNQALTPAGFNITVVPGVLPPGKHTIGVEVVSHDRSLARARNSWNVQVR